MKAHAFVRAPDGAAACLRAVRAPRRAAHTRAARPRREVRPCCGAPPGATPHARRGAAQASMRSVETPESITGLVTRRLLVMTFLEGSRITALAVRCRAAGHA